ncbi:MAG: hypothetical protein WCG85_09880, partial [Polyangia bacterium]
MGQTLAGMGCATLEGPGGRPTARTILIGATTAGGWVTVAGTGASGVISGTGAGVVGAVRVARFS